MDSELEGIGRRPRRTGLGAVRSSIGLIAGIVALGLIGLGLRAVPVMVGQQQLAQLLAVPAPATTAPSAPASVAGPAPTNAATPTARSRATATPSGRASTPPSRKPTKTKAAPIPVPATGPGTYDGAHLRIPAASKSGQLIRYDVRIEDGLHIDPDLAAELIQTVLNDKRSWRGTGRWRFQLVSTADQASLHAYIVTPGTTDGLCAPLLTRGQVSCQNGNKVVLNAMRWLRGADAYGSDVVDYRRYLINHEFGHSLGKQHVGCPGQGEPAPVMMQQTKGVGSCDPNPWPMEGRH